MKRPRLSTLIVAGLLLGIGVGYVLNTAVPPGPEHKEIAGYFHMLADIFLRMIKMIIAPLVFAGIVTGMLGSESPKEVGRLSAKAMVWFVTASVFSLVLGLVLANMYSIGSGMPTPASGVKTDINPGALSVKTFITHLVPQSVVAAMASNDIIAIVLFSLFFGFALSAIRKVEPTTAPLAHAIEGILKTMLQVTHYVMWVAPIGVFGATASAVMEHGLGVVLVYGKFIGATYSGFAILLAMLIATGYVFLRGNVFRLLSEIRTPALIAFSTSKHSVLSNAA